ncbi:MAG TPA: amidase family protein [Sphingomonas sp.]|uniref:amidase family protein n=1 Tax=Sphingomonas sp. TaxID=28214 RepID=UPI002EDB1628
MTRGLAPLSALQTAAAIRAGETTALAECEAAIARIEVGDGEINAVVVRDFDRARAAARALDAAGPGDPSDQPLFGVPMTVKESFDVAGLATTWGYPEHADHHPAADAMAVRRLRRAGAVILGKTNVPPGLADIQANNPIHGRTLNPHDPERVSGGSSGGAAAALAAGYVPLEIGSDIGGSIRTPAAFCGVWGHKPTFGALAMDGHLFPRTTDPRTVLSVIGPMARDPRDLAAALDVLSDLPLPRAVPREPREYRVAILPEHPLARAARDVRAAVERVGGAFADANARVEHAADALPDLARQQEDYIRMLLAAMARGEAPAGTPPLTPARWAEMRAAQGRSMRAWMRFFDRFDILVAPCWGTTAFRHDDTPMAQRTLDVDGEVTPFGAQLAYPGLATYPNLPATSVPIGRDADGLPVGVQVIAAPYLDHNAIAAASLAHDLTRS